MTGHENKSFFPLGMAASSTWLLHLKLLTVWLAMVLVLLLPLLVAADSGGVLPWTQWIMGFAAIMAWMLVLPTLCGNTRNSSLQAMSVSLVLLAFAALAVFQTVPIPDRLHRFLAPGSSDAYQSAKIALQLAPINADVERIPDLHPISVSVWLTTANAAMLAILATFALVTAQLFTTRERITALLVAFAMTGAIQAGLGLYQVNADAAASVWGIKSLHGGVPFGSFINRSHAALMMNLGLAGGLGMIAWRLAALTGSKLDGDVFSLSEFLDVLFDRVAILGIACILLSSAGLLACGSRGGMAGAVTGLLLAFGFVQSLHRGRGVVPVLLSLGLIVAILVVKFDLPTKTLDRLEGSAEEVMAMDGLQDVRLAHWKDGWRAGFVQPLLGWGIGTYRYAYLPYQQTSAETWFLNADNLWLEWFVETGLVGTAAVLAMLTIYLFSLRTLNQSTDPIDHGLATAGWFALGAIAISQVFDFGLRIPANAVAATILVAAVVARASTLAHGAPLRTGRLISAAISLGLHPYHVKSRLRWATDRSNQIVLVLAGLLALASLFATRSLYAYAEGDYLARHATFLPRGEQFDLAAATDLDGALDRHLKQYPADYPSWLQRAKLATDLARFEAAQTSTSADWPQDWRANYDALSIANLRSRWYQESISPIGTKQRTAQIAPLFPISTTDWDKHSPVTSANKKNAATALREQRIVFGSALHRARSFAVQALVHCPLSDTSHIALINLDFAGGTPSQSQALLESVIQLRRQNSDSMLAVGQLAMQSGSWKLMVSAFARAMQLEPQLTHPIANIFPVASSYSFEQALPNDPVSVSIAAKRELKAAKPNTDLLNRAVLVLSEDLPSERKIHLEQLHLLAAIHQHLGQNDLAADTLANAVALSPGDLESRYLYATTLRKFGMIDEARQQARAGRQIAPEDTRFQNLLTAMSEIEEINRQ